MAGEGADEVNWLARHAWLATYLILCLVALLLVLGFHR